MSISELIGQLIKLGEQEKIEAKTASEIGKSVLETICAFANEPDLDGGHVLLGVHKLQDELEMSYQVIGVNNPEKIIEDLVTQCRTIFNKPVKVHAEQQMIDNKIVIGVNVPEVENGHKPIFFKRKGLPEGAFRRFGSSDIRCTEDDLQIFYQNRSALSYDKTILPDATWDDIDPETIRLYRIEREKINPNAIELEWGDQELLESLCCIKKAGEEIKATICGILMFGKQTAMRKFFPSMRVDYIREPGKQWMSDITNRYTAVEIRDSIINSIRRAESAIMDDLPKAFSLPKGSLQREDIPVIPLTVIREAIVNALMHRNYQVEQAIQIIRYSNRIEILNPGYSLIPEEELGKPGSKSRNPQISEILHETRFAEKKGSGIRIMRDNMKKADLSPPTFESNRRRDVFTSRFLFHHFLDEEDIVWLGGFKQYNLTGEQARALIFVREVGAIDNTAYRNLNQVDSLNSSSSLRRLRDLKLLLSKNRSTATYYVPGEVFLNSLAKGPQLGGKGPQLGGKGPQLEFSERESEVDLKPAKLPQELQDYVSKLGKKASSTQLHTSIMKLCQWRELTANELAFYLRRDKKRLVKKFLSRMVDNKLLVYKYPQMPNHPNQAYRSKVQSVSNTKRKTASVI